MSDLRHRVEDVVWETKRIPPGAFVAVRCKLDGAPWGRVCFYSDATVRHYGAEHLLRLVDTAFRKRVGLPNV